MPVMKELQITPDIKAKLQNSTDNPDIDTSTLKVFEVIATNSKPLTFPGRLFDKATITRSTLQIMADSLANGGSVPLIKNHDSHSNDASPVGRVFAGQVVDAEDGSSELRALMFLDAADKKAEQLIVKLNSGALDEVSIGAVFSKAMSSETGFDFLGPDATMEDIFTRIDDEGNEMGVNGAHVILSGLEQWLELSLVTRGAADNAKVLSRAKQRMGADRLQKLAASNIPFSARLLTASIGKQPKEIAMDGKEFTDAVSKLTEELATAKVEAAAAVAELATAKAEADKMADKIAEFEGKITAFETQIADFKSIDATAYAETQEWLDAQVKAAMVAASDTGEAPETFADKIAMIKACGLKAHQLVAAAAEGNPNPNPENTRSAAQMALLSVNHTKAQGE